MAAPSFTYTLTNGTTADASQVMQDFNDLLNGITDGSKDLSINALTCAGAATLNGHINLGNASGDDLTILASLASTLPIKTTNAYDIGSSTKGLAGVYFGANSQTTRIIGSSSMASTWTLTLPTGPGTNNYVLATNGSGVTSWVSGSALVGNATSQVRADTGNGHGSTNTKIRRFTNITTVGSGITATASGSSASSGTEFTINEAGVYAISYTDRSGSGGFQMGISLNSASLTTAIGSLTETERLILSENAVGIGAHCSVVVRLAANDVIRAHTDGTLNATTTWPKFVITQVLKL